MLLNTITITIGPKIQIIYMITLVFWIYVQNWILNQNHSSSPDYLFHLGTPIFHFSLSPFCNGGTVYPESHRTGSTVGFWGSSFFMTGLPSYFFVFWHSNLPLYLLFLCLGWIVCRWGIVVTIHMLLLLACYLGFV